MATHVLSKLGQTPITDIDQRDIRDVLAPIWHSKTRAGLTKHPFVGALPDLTDPERRRVQAALATIEAALKRIRSQR